MRCSAGPGGTRPDQQRIRRCAANIYAYGRQACPGWATSKMRQLWSGVRTGLARPSISVTEKLPLFTTQTFPDASSAIEKGAAQPCTGRREVEAGRVTAARRQLAHAA